MAKRRIIAIACGVPLLAAAGYVATVTWLGDVSPRPSICRGTVASGSLESGQRLPYARDNYRAYSLIGYAVGRTFVHGTVRETISDAYATLHRDQPELRFVYAESGWPWGGRIAPHKSHRNGTAVDFLVPVRTPDGAVAELPTSLFNQLGYAAAIDRPGRPSRHRIDFEAMARHLLALEQAARARGIGITRVIFDVSLQPQLWATASGARLRGRIPFNKAQSWVPHDTHYHVDFDVPCR